MRFEVRRDGIGGKCRRNRSEKERKQRDAALKPESEAPVAAEVTRRVLRTRGIFRLLTSAATVDSMDMAESEGMAATRS